MLLYSDQKGHGRFTVVPELSRSDACVQKGTFVNSRRDLVRSILRRHPYTLIFKIDFITFLNNLEVVTEEEIPVKKINPVKDSKNNPNCLLIIKKNE